MKPQDYKPLTQAILHRLGLRSRTEMARKVATIYVRREGDRYITERQDVEPRLVHVKLDAPTDEQLGATVLAELRQDQPKLVYDASRCRSIESSRASRKMAADED